MIEKQIVEKEDQNKFTLFWDMLSGGDQKLNWAKIYVNLPEQQAKQWFKQKFNRNPENITCGCCGEDYSISDGNSLEEITEYHRMIGLNLVDGLITVEEYLQRENVLYVEVTQE